MTDLIEARTKKNFFTEMMFLANTTGVDQKEYIKNIIELARLLKKYLKDRDLIKKIEFEPNKYWKSIANKKSIYNIDGGQLSLSIPGSASFGIRVGVLRNRPGDQSDNWCDFSESQTLTSNLVDRDNSHYEQQEEEFVMKYDKMLTGSRMIMEASEVVKQQLGKGKWDKPSTNDIIYLHGPIAYESTMYHLATDEENPIPPFKKEFCKTLFPDINNVFFKDLKKKELDIEFRYFLPLYSEILKQIQASKIPTYGVVERIGGVVSPGPVMNAVIDELFHNQTKRSYGRLYELKLKKLERTWDIKPVGTPSDGNEIEKKFKRRSVKDDIIFDLILDPGEYISPVQIIKQPEGKWPRGKYSYVSMHSHLAEPFATFLKVSEDKRPFRIETLNVLDSYDEDMKLTFHSAKLLPQYCFPLGLDTVDKLSKVPSWLRNSMRSNYINNLLRKTLESNASKQQINMMLKSFVSGRNWWVRPK